MRHDRESVVDAALRILDEWGLSELTMRRLGAALEVQPSALYHHFENKQTLLAAVADRIQETARPVPSPNSAGTRRHWPRRSTCATRCSPTVTAPRSC
ncbi:hypothetical protein GCM10025869_31290 [Homoserinibacter gongjuensis]|uniref:HTH tetR-type domain-containing protein n=1 Tax=Homoserinibacter gongjuensis TaxID=1162968 RepID=A0ABQ6JZ84_9MICO|nr:hypothetical protein GCM10025869_31290 [Homoserinibacter gongjuensis]